MDCSARAAPGEDDTHNSPSMADLERPRRANAGRNISKLMEEEEAAADDFYSTAYGGFAEEDEDNEYEVILINAHVVYMRTNAVLSVCVVVVA